MTQDSLRRGQELVRIIKEINEFLDLLNQVANGTTGYASLTLTAKSAITAPGLTLSRYPSVAAAFAKALKQEANKLEQEFRDL